MIEICVRIETTNPDPDWVIERARRELELTFGDACSFVYVKNVTDETDG